MKIGKDAPGSPMGRPAEAESDIRNPELFNRNHSFIIILFTDLIATV